MGALASRSEVGLLLLPAIVVLASSSVSTDLVPPHRKDDVVVLVMMFGLCFSWLARILTRAHLQKFNAYLFIRAMVVLFPLVIWMFARSAGAVAVIQSLFVGIMMLAPILAYFNTAHVPLRIDNVIVAALLAYVVIVITTFFFSAFDNDEFMRTTGVNTNALLIPVFPLFAALMRKTGGLYFSFFRWAAMLGVICVAIGSGSKQSILFVAVIVLAALVKNRNISTLISLLCLVGLFFGAMWIGGWTGGRAGEIVSIASGNFEQSPSLMNRLSLVEFYRNAIANHWVIGYGVGKSMLAYQDVFNSTNVSMFMSHEHTPHNSWLRMLVEGGAPFLIGMVFYHYFLWVRKRRMGLWRGEFVLYFSVIFAILANSILTESMFSWEYWIAIALLIVIGKGERRNYRSENKGW